MTFFRRLIVIFSLAFTLATAWGQAPVQAWVQRYRGPGNGNDQATAIAVDNGGNVFVAGPSANTNGFYVSDYAVLKYSSSGTPLWTNRFDASAGFWDQAIGMALDADGNVFIVCNATNTTGVCDYATIAYSNDGLPLWTNRFGGLPAAHDRVLAVAVGIAVDRSNHIFVTATSTNELTSWDFTTVAYSTGGEARWTNRYSGPSNATDYVSAISVNSQGEVIIAGFSQVPGSNTVESVIVAYSNSGETLWTNRYRRGLAEFTMALAIDGEDNIFVTGPGLVASTDNATFGFSRTGVGLWTNVFSGVVNDGGKTCAIAVDDTGRVFVTGRSPTPNQITGWATVAYSATGTPLWTNRFRGPGSSFDWPQALVVDGAGNVIVAGTTSGTTNSYDAVTIAYSAVGVPLWTNRFSGPANSADQARALAVGNNGNLFVAGISGGDSLAIKYSLSSYLRMDASDNGVMLSWTNAAFGWTNLGFALQSAPTSTGTFTNLPGATSPYTNHISGAQQFFRLISN